MNRLPPFATRHSPFAGSWAARFPHLLVLGALAFLTLAWAPAVFAQCMQWTRLADVGSPGSQVGHCMAYNPDRQRVTLFTADEWADLWEYDGRQWLRLFITPGPRPSPRVDSAIAYDRARGELVLVGGFGRAEDTQLADTWTCRITTDGTGNVVGTWSQRPNFPDFALPDEDDPSGQMGESGARAEHTLVYDDAARAVRLFGGKARVVRGSRYQRPYNLQNYSSGRGAWNGSAWVERTWSNRVPGPTNDPDQPILEGTMYERVELGRKAIAATYDPRRQRVVTFGGLRQIYQHYDDGSAWDPDKNDAYVESMPHLQYFPGRPGDLTSGFPSFSRNLLGSVGQHCGTFLERRVFGAQLVHDTRRDRYVAFGGAYAFGESRGGLECSPLYNIETSEYSSRLLPQNVTFKEWDPQRPEEPDFYLTTRLPSFSGGFDGLPHPPASRIRHTMVFDEHRGITVVYGGWDGNAGSFNTMARETWEYGPGPLDFLEHPAALSELCYGDTLTLTAVPLAVVPPNFQWFKDGKSIENATNRVLTVPEASPQVAGNYTCELIDRCGNRVASRPAVVRVGGPPVITQPPASLNVCPGDGASAIFFFQSDYPPTVQWFRLATDAVGDFSVDSFSAVPGADSNELRIPGMKPEHSGYYRARVTNRCGTAWTPVIVLTAGVWLRLEPGSSTNEVCSAWQLRVRATGKGPLTYQWRRNGEALTNTVRVTGANTGTLAFAGLRYFDDAAYDCLVRDACHTVTTRVATITVNPNPPFLLSDTNGPAAREHHGLIYDSRRGVSVLFGGLGTGATIADIYRNDSWEYDGTNWIRRTTANAPSPRADFGLAFDRHRGVAVLFGGMTNSGFSGTYPNGETWEYDGTNWTQRFPAHAPAPRSRHALFYDPVRRVTTLYGGDTLLANPRAGDIWTWDGTDWTERPITGDRPQFGAFGSPPHPQMVWDHRRGYAVLPPTSLNQGGALDYATWTWDGTNWTKRPYAFTGFGLAPAQAGSGLGLVYDTFRGEVIYWGGTGTDQANVWRWNGENWRRDALAEFVGFHLYAAAAYDERRDSVVQFGGNYSGADPVARGVSRRTFERVLADEPLLLRQPVVLDDPATNKLFLRVVAAGAPPLTYEWQREGVKLNEGFPYSGATGDTLAVDRALSADAGLYRCVVKGRCGEAISQPITLQGTPPTAALILTLASGPVAGQPGLTLSWSGVGVVLEQASTPQGPWTAVNGATSPYTPALIGPGGYFRLRGP